LALVSLGDLLLTAIRTWPLASEATGCRRWRSRLRSIGNRRMLAPQMNMLSSRNAAGYC